jgi:hypothetical protein
MAARQAASSLGRDFAARAGLGSVISPAAICARTAALGSWSNVFGSWGNFSRMLGNTRTSSLIYQLGRNGGSDLGMTFALEFDPRISGALTGVVKLSLVQCGSNNLLLRIQFHL